MTDFMALLTSPIGYSVIIGIAVAAALAYFFIGGKRGKEVVLVWERLKPGVSLFHKVRYYRPNNPGEYVIDFGKEKKFLIPEEKRDTFEDVIDDKGKRFKMWGMENGQITRFADSLASVGSTLLDHATVTAAMTRASAKRLASPKLPKGDLYLYLIMGCVVGVALGWILYPQFNHPPPVIEYYRQLPNGTFVPLGGP